MKKRIFATLAAFALVITVGGVYASWNYAQQSAGEVTKTYDLSLTAESVSTKKGTIEISSSGFTLELDQASATDYTINLRLTGEIVVTFTPAAGADADVTQNGIVLQAAFSETYGSWTDTINNTLGETDVDILTVSEPFTLNDGNAINGSYTLNNSVLAAKLQVGTIKLESKAEYDAFKAQLENQSAKLTLTISEYTVG